MQYIVPSLRQYYGEKGCFIDKRQHKID